jgi:asparagine synthase (glutamine-hydrolysing)
VCGIAGIVRAEAGPPVQEEPLLRMARSIRHRGPDGFGLVLDHGAGMVSARLAIFDIPGGWQPIEKEPGGGVIVYNGEVYNHPELRRELESRGEAFETTTDTEVVLRLLELDGLGALDRLNGQFAFAWWQAERRRLTLVRDRFGVRPLHYSLLGDGTIVFGSEAKALFASGVVAAEPDPLGVDDVFTLWGPRPPRTAFLGVSQLPPGGVLVWERGEIVSNRRWWEPRYGASGEPEADLEELLRDSVRLRLRADVPVGAYLSGGLDSSLITALAQQETDHNLRTFSVAFADPRYDERAHQEEVAEAIGTRHHVLEIGPADIAGAFPDVVWHAEAPLIRTAPVPLFLLAREVRAQGITVVATGEGADELFWGYELFREVVARELNRTDPEAAAALIDELYLSLGAREGVGPAMRRFILETGAADELLGSHLTRSTATGAVKALYGPALAAAAGAEPSLERLREALPGAFGGWSPLERAAWLEVSTLLEPYLLAAQGDRVSMGHGVEGRYPFLDHRVFAYSTALPEAQKLAGSADKVALREIAKRVLPAGIAARPKQPYRAPEVAPFFSPDAPEWVTEAVSDEALAATAMWDPARVRALIRRCEAGRATGMREGMALIGVLSSQLWHRQFVGRGAGDYPPETAEPRVRIDRTARSAPTPPTPA